MKNHEADTNFAMGKTHFKPTREFNRFFICIIIVCSIIVSTNRLLYSYDGIGFRNSWEFSWLYLAFLCTPFIFYVWKSEYKISDFGVTLVNWKQSVKEGLLLSMAVMAIFIFGLLTCHFIYGPNLLYAVYSHGTISWFDGFFYLGHAMVQEFIFRGIIQTSLRRFLIDPRGHLSILCTSLIFGFAHIHTGFLLVGITFLSGFPLGFLYFRHRSLVGVCILHGIVGMLSIFFWNYLTG